MADPVETGDPELAAGPAGGAASPPAAPVAAPPSASSPTGGPAVFPWQSCNEGAERMIIIGATRSGKTTKAIQLVAQAIQLGARVVWWDTKGLNDPGLPAVPASSIASAPQLSALLDEHQALTVQLDPYGDEEDQINAVMQAGYEMGNVLIVMDDAMGVLTAGRAPKWLRNVITQGGARGIGFMSIVQRAAWIPRILLSEAEHIVAFELHDVDDIETLTRVGNRSLEQARDLQRHEYLWYSRSERRAVACAPISI